MGSCPILYLYGETIIRKKVGNHHTFPFHATGVISGTMLRRLLQSTHHSLQPDESIRLRFGLKQPGTNFEVQQVSMDFFYNSLIPNKLPDAYERLLLDAMRGDALLYSRSDALELSWHYLAPLIEHWEKEKEENLVFYPAGSPIPREITHIYSHPYVLEAPVCTPNP